MPVLTSSFQDSTANQAILFRDVVIGVPESPKTIRNTAQTLADNFPHLAHNHFIAHKKGSAEGSCEPPASVCTMQWRERLPQG
jgi:hypothetical protein